MSAPRKGVLSARESANSFAGESELSSDGRYLAIGGTRSPDSFHMELGKVMLENCGHFPIEEPGLTQLRDAFTRVAERAARR